MNWQRVWEECWALLERLVRAIESIDESLQKIATKKRIDE